jgi:hypothetical protein
MVNARGGMLSCCEQILLSQDFQLGGPAMPGDLGLIPQDRGPFKHVMAICIEPNHWAGKTEEGFGIMSDALRFSCPS